MDRELRGIIVEPCRSSGSKPCWVKPRHFQCTYYASYCGTKNDICVTERLEARSLVWNIVVELRRILPHMPTSLRGSRGEPRYAKASKNYARCERDRKSM